MTQESISQDLDKPFNSKRDKDSVFKDKRTLALRRNSSSLDVISDVDDAGKSSSSKLEDFFRSRLRTIGFMQIVVAFVCITISIVLCEGIQSSYTGSGIWCSLFFLLVGLINYVSTSSGKRLRELVTFSVLGCHFGALMITVEGVEIWILLHEKELHLTPIVLNASLALLAVIEIALTVAAVIFRYVHRRKTPRKSNGKQVRFEEDDRESPINIVPVVKEAGPSW